MVNIENSSKCKIIATELIHRIYNREELYHIIIKNEIEPTDLEMIHRIIINNGAGIYLRGQHIASLALLHPITLHLLTKQFKNGKFTYENEDEHTSAYLITNVIIRFFEKQ